MAASSATSSPNGAKSVSQDSGRARDLSELPQEADVVLDERPHVGDLVAHLGAAVDAEAEGEARPLRGVDPTASNTAGSTMPQPPSSIHPVCEQVRQPAPSQMVQVISNSADGSVNGK